jgi:hypothetical protein
MPMSVECKFTTLAAQYEFLVEQLDNLHRQNKTCTDTIDIVIQGFIANADYYDYKVVESLLGALQRVQERVVVELVRVRVEKALYAFKMAQMKQKQG